jgi:hypothetical protein
MYQSVFIYATLTTLRVLENENNSFAYYFFFILSIQFLGFGLAGFIILKFYLKKLVFVFEKVFFVDFWFGHLK